MNISPLAGKPAPPEMLTNIAKLVNSFYCEVPDANDSGQRVSFGTSGHRGSSLRTTFNENHVIAITQAICEYRTVSGITGPLFIGIDTHALSEPAFACALEVLAANEVEVMVAAEGGYTPTPAVSRAILVHNRGLSSELADGIVITPSHNPPEDGGFKYNTPNGGPADTNVTGWIQNRANAILADGLKDVRRITYRKALAADTTHSFDYLHEYVVDLPNVIDMDLLRDSQIRMAVDPLGGAGVRYWEAIAEEYRLNLTVVNKLVDTTFRFMTVDWDGRIRMDPSSPYAMHSLIGLRGGFDIAFACDPDHDRHGIVTNSQGLLSPNHYLTAAIYYLFQHRPNWPARSAIGKTVVSTLMIDRVATKLGRGLCEVPVGFKWFVEGLLDGSIAFGGEESAGASFLRRDGTVWSTDKDGLIPALLSAEITAKTGRDPGDIYKELASEFGEAAYERVEAKATAAQKTRLAKLNPSQITSTTLAGDAIVRILSNAPGNDKPIGGIKVETANGWFAARPSGTEDIYKIYAESLKGQEHLQMILSEAQQIVDDTLAAD